MIIKDTVTYLRRNIFNFENELLSVVIAFTKQQSSSLCLRQKSLFQNVKQQSKPASVTKFILTSYTISLNRSSGISIHYVYWDSERGIIKSVQGPEKPSIITTVAELRAVLFTSIILNTNKRKSTEVNYYHYQKSLRGSFKE